MTNVVSSSGSEPSHPIFDNLNHDIILDRIFFYCSEAALSILPRVNRTLNAAISHQHDCTLRIALAALNKRGLHLPEIPLCLRAQLFAQHTTNPRVKELQKQLLGTTRAAVTNNAIPRPPGRMHAYYRLCQIIDAQILARDLEGAAATVEKMSPCKELGNFYDVFPEDASPLRDPVLSSSQLSNRCKCTAYARLARAQYLSGDFEASEATIRKTASNEVVFTIVLAELAAKMTEDPSQKEKAMALFNEAREKISPYYKRLVSLRILLHIAQLEAASDLSPTASLASAEKISNEDLPFFEKFGALIYHALAKHKFTNNPIPLNLYDTLQALPFPTAIDCDEEGSLHASTKLLPLIALHIENKAVALQKEREVFAHWLECASQNDDEDSIYWSQHNTADDFCRLASLQRLACTEAPETVVQALHEFDEANLSSAIYAALLSAIQHNRVELMQLLRTTFRKQFRGIDNPLRQLASRFFPTLFENNPIPIQSAKEILEDMPAPTPENRKLIYRKARIATKSGLILLATALLRNMRPHLSDSYYNYHDFAPSPDSTLYSCSDPHYSRSHLWLPLGSTEQ